MALAGIELKYLVNRISAETNGYYTSNIYGIDRDSILFKLHHPEKPDVLLVLSTSGIWITSVRIKQVTENRMVRRLRDTLRRLRLESITQPGLERLTYLKFGGFDKHFVLIGEFFGDGNIILCDAAGKVLALQHSINVRHRRLAVGLQYEAPPPAGRDATAMETSEYMGVLNAKMACARWLGRTLGLPRRYAEGIPRAAGIDPKAAGTTLKESDVVALQQTATSTISDVINGNHTPAILVGSPPEASPVILDETDAQPYPDFMSALDHILTQKVLERGRQEVSGEAQDRVAKLQGVLVEQEKAIDIVQHRADAMVKVAASIPEMLALGMLRLDASGVDQILARHGATLDTDKGAPVLRILDENIRVNLDAPLQSTASILYSASKRQAAAVPAIQTMISKTQKKLSRATNQSSHQQETVAAAEVRKRNWFERYRWFYTSGGSLAIGGRDAPSNSAVVRKHMEDGDRVFHAEIFGSPFFILKDGGATPADIREVAQATVCFSRVWRETMHGSAAYWVDPAQVKKSAPTGQYLPKGSFTIRGKRNFAPALALRLAVGIMHKDQDLLVCGPPDSISHHTTSYVMIEPGGYEVAAAARTVRYTLLEMQCKGADTYHIDDYIRVLPPGKSRIVKDNA